MVCSSPRISTATVKALATAVFLLVTAALFLYIRRKSGLLSRHDADQAYLAAKFNRQTGDSLFLTLPDGSSVIKPEKLQPPINASDIYISLLTAPVYHESRFALQYVTWLQTLDLKNVRVITDSDENRWLKALEREGGSVITPTCHISKIVKSAAMMCCKTGAQFEEWYKVRESGRKYKWYCHVDDDLYLNIEALVDTLKQYDPSRDCYVGAWSVLERYHKVKRIPLSHRLAPKLAEYSERKRDEFRYASGPSYCISEHLMLRVEKYLRGKKFEENCRKSQAAMDDILPGLIIEGVLGVDLNDTGEFKGQLDDIMFYNSPGAQKIKNKEITMSFEGIVIKHGAFTHQQDPHGILSYHCLRHPNVSWCSHHGRSP